MKDLNHFIKILLPRVLTQVNRDPSSKSYGSFDRNWWHYKIRDFSSIIVQQGGYLLYEYSKLDEFKEYSDFLRNTAKSSLYFWAERASKYGAFEEYYPNEDGYPPLAFSTLASAKLIKELDIYDAKIEKALKKASLKLLNRFEGLAANQQVAGLAALSIIKSIDASLVNDNDFYTISEKTLRLQDEEGWFMEYGGPDLGYLSVTMDCLWDLYDYTNDVKYKESAKRAFEFIFSLVGAFGSDIGMLNARNTDYIVPYGISRFLLENDIQTRYKAAYILDILYSKIESNHFLYAIDDRYLIHYIGHSLLRYYEILLKNNIDKLLAKQIEIPKETIFANSGYYLKSQDSKKLLISFKKRGVFTFKQEDNYFSDFGYIITSNKKQYITHWWNDNYTSNISQNEITIKSKLVPIKEQISSPIKHIILRFVSFIFGNKLIGILKNKLIFSEKVSTIEFRRSIVIKDNTIEVVDNIEGLLKGDFVEHAPRSSKRHVASADSFHMEDAFLNRNVKVKQVDNRISNNHFTSKTLIG